MLRLWDRLIACHRISPVAWRRLGSWDSTGIWFHAHLHNALIGAIIGIEQWIVDDADVSGGMHRTIRILDDYFHS